VRDHKCSPTPVHRDVLEPSAADADDAGLLEAAQVSAYPLGPRVVGHQGLCAGRAAVRVELAAERADPIPKAT
jgi:hypothetical protein